MPDSSSKAASEGSTVTLSPSTFLVAMSMYSGQFEKLIFFWLVDRSLLTQDSAVCCAPSVPQALSSDPLDRARTDSDAPRRNVRRLTPLDCISAPSRALSCAIATPPERTISVGILSEQGTANKGFSRRETALQRNPLPIGPFSFDLPPHACKDLSRGLPISEPERTGNGLDDVSKAIIEELQQDGRRSYAAIGKVVGLSEAAVRQRVQRLIDH